MDESYFDALTRSLTSGASRRGVLAGLISALLELLARVAIDKDASARRRKRRKKKCKGDKKRCGKKCRNLLTDSANCGECGKFCPSGGCVHGACTCTSDGTGECPNPCSCVSRLGGGNACGTEPDAIVSCSDDAACSLGSFCSNQFDPPLCIGECPT